MVATESLLKDSENGLSNKRSSEKSSFKHSQKVNYQSRKKNPKKVVMEYPERDQEEDQADQEDNSLYDSEMKEMGQTDRDFKEDSHGSNSNAREELLKQDSEE